jgi:two-component system, OmpR family, heavy metal sensor histidine kinase CusS
MNEKYRMGIKVKMALAFSLVFIVLSFSFNLLGYRRIRAILIADNDRYLLSRASSLLDKTEINPVIIPLPDKNSFIRVLYRTGSKSQVLFQSPGILERIRTPASTGVTDTLGMRVAYVKSSSEDVPAELVMVESGGLLEGNLQLLWRLLFISSTVSVIISGIVSYLLARILLLPLQRIILAAQNINTNRLRDLIPVKATQDELQELSSTINAMLGRIDESVQQQQNFFASASHELKTPLTILRAELEVGLKKPGLQKDVRNLFTNQLEEIRRLQEIVGEFMVVSQLKVGSLVIYRRPFDLSDLVLKVFDQLRPLLRQKALEPAILFDVEASGFIVHADEDKIRMVLINLLENAAKYAVGGSIVSCKINMLLKDDLWTILFTNNIQEEKLDVESLQKAFFRVGALPNGSGLGLWLCGEIVRLHGGWMELHSASHQFGVQISLPVFFYPAGI